MPASSPVSSTPGDFLESFFQAQRTGHRRCRVGFVADNPTDHHIFLSAFTGVRDLQATSSGITLATPRGEVQVMDAAAFRLHYGIEPPDFSRGMRFAAVRFQAGDLGAVRAACARAGVAVSEPMGRIVSSVLGATLVFEAA